MKIVVAPDSLKGSLTAAEACKAISEGVLRACPDAEIVSVPMADGGEGTTEALVSATGGRLLSVAVIGPLPDAGTVTAQFGLLGDAATAVVEMARASGLPLVPPERRNPLHTTTYGTGELIAAAMDADVNKLIVGIGGSATTDCGAGMAQALGAMFFDTAGTRITHPLTGGALVEVAGMDLSEMHPGIVGCRVELACDVDNPLLGASGAAEVYGPQKGASPADVRRLEKSLTHFIGLVEDHVGRVVRDIPGAGDAGGLGAGLLAFLDAEPKGGVDTVLAASDLAGKVVGADLVLTAEGRIDAQTARGKTISGVARVARSAGAAVIALAGRLGDGVEALAPLGMEAIHAIAPEAMPLEEAMANARTLLADAAERVMRQWR